jgi:hypothetical protein
MRHGSEWLAPVDSIPFFCECGSPTCSSSIWMTVAAFDATVAAETGWLLLEGHAVGALALPGAGAETRDRQVTTRATISRVRNDAPGSGALELVVPPPAREPTPAVEVAG